MIQKPGYRFSMKGDLNMKLSKLKIIPVTIITVLSLGIFSTSAHAQIGVKDDTSAGILRNIETNSNQFEDAYKAEFGAQVTHRDLEDKHYTLQIEKYEAQIARLDAMITLFNKNATVDTENKLIGDLKPNATIFNGNDTSKVAALNTNRTSLATLRKNAESGFSASKSLDDYRGNHGLKKVSSIYSKNPRLSSGLQKLYDTAYNTEVTVNTVSKASEDRMTRYTELSDQAKASEDLKTSLDINNALLLENGRNLALLIDLQTAQLDSQVVQLRKETQAKNAAAKTFGESNELGLLALEGLSAGINAITAIN